MSIRVLGFDNGTGLPAPVDYRDHPEMWVKGQFGLHHDIEPLRQQLPDFARLVIEDVGDTVADVHQDLAEAPLGFGAIDVDFYSSTKRLMPLFEFDRNATCQRRPYTWMTSSKPSRGIPGVVKSLQSESSMKSIPTKNRTKIVIQDPALLRVACSRPPTALGAKKAPTAIFGHDSASILMSLGTLPG